MLVLTGFVLAVVTVPLARGRLLRLVDVRFDAVWALIVSAVLQVVALRLLRDGDADALGLVHVTSYLFAAVFLWRNRRVPGLWLVGLGGAANLAAISANGGIMPASAEAWEAAGLPPSETFTNSAVLAEPNLGFLGDTFAIPHPLPFANVFSIGDVLLVVGAFVVLHALTRSRLVPSGAHQFSELRHHRSFMYLWSAQAVSNLGDWTYSLAVAATLAHRVDATHVLATLLITQVAPAAVVGLLGGPLIDRVNRTWLMAGTDIVRALAVGSLVLAGAMSLPHVYLVAGILGLCGALFQPSMHAVLPNLVPRDRLVAANALVSGTYHMAIMIGPVLGGVLVTQLGATSAFAINASSFALSAVLVSRVRAPKAIDADEVPPRPLAALKEGLRYSVTTPLVRGILLVLGLIVFASALRSPLEPVFILQTLGRDPSALGLVGGAWGLGMLLGSAAAPAAARRWPRERLLWISVALVGVAVLGASRATVLSPVLIFWLFAGAGNSMGTIAYESLLQERTPDSLRGRVMAATEAGVHLSFLLGALVAGWLGSQVGIRGSYVISGVLFLLAAALSRRVLSPSRIGAWVVSTFGSESTEALPPVADRTALVVASDLDRAWSLCAALDAAGFLVERAVDGRDLRVALRGAAPQLLILDTNQIDEDLLDLTELVRRAPRWDGVAMMLAGPAPAGSELPGVPILPDVREAAAVREQAERLVAPQVVPSALAPEQR